MRVLWMSGNTLRENEIVCIRKKLEVAPTENKMRENPFMHHGGFAGTGEEKWLIDNL